jgi:ribosomal protein L24E
VVSGTTKDLSALTLAAAATTSPFRHFQYLQVFASHVAKMRTYDDTFSATKIYPGKVRKSPTFHRISSKQASRRPPVVVYTDIFSNIQGKLYVRGDSKIFRFQNGKTESLFLQRKNPRRIAWTVLYRRMHKKGISEVRKDGLLIIKLIWLAETPRDLPPL